MADLDNLAAAQTVKIAGSDSSGVESNFVNATAAGRLMVDVSGGHTLSTLNSTATPLGIAGVFTGGWEEVINYADLSIIYRSDQNSTASGVVIQWSSNGTNVDASDTFTFDATGDGQQLSFGIKARYFRIIYTNGGVAQGFFRLQTILHPVHIRSSTHRVDDPIDTEDDAELVKATITGKAQDGNYYNVQVDNEGRLVTSAITGFGANFSFGDVVTAVAGTTVPVRRTAYTEQTTNAQRQLLSSSALDTAAGTGARTVLLTYYDQTGAGPFTETVTLNGITAVNTTNTNICFIEKIEVVTAGSTGANQGIITLRTLAAVTIGTIAAQNNQTFWAHHYVPVGKTANITGISCGGSSTVVGGGGLFIVKALPIGVANAIEKQVSDFVRLYGQSSTFARAYVSPIKVSGPARLIAYVTPETGTSTTYRASIDFFEP